MVRVKCPFATEGGREVDLMKKYTVHWAVIALHVEVRAVFPALLS